MNAPLNGGGSIADAMAYSQWSDEQKRIARTGIEYEDRIEKMLAAAREEAFDAGRAAGLADKTSVDRDAVHLIYDRLLIFRQCINVNDSRYTGLGEIVGDLGTLLDG